MSDWKSTKGPIDLNELQAYIQNLSDIRNKEDFPRLRFREKTFVVTDILNKFEGRYRMITTDSKGRKKLFDISDTLYSDGSILYFANEFVEMKWGEYYSYWRNLGTRPDVIDWGGEAYIVYSITKITGDDSLYLTIGSKPDERIMIQLNKETVITRDHTRLSGKPKWIVEFAKQLSYQMKWD